MRFYLKMTAGLLLLVLFVGACSPSEPAEVSEGVVEIVEEDQAQNEEPAAGSDKLVIYSGRSESLIQPIVDQFEAATGIDVDVRYGSTSEIASLLLQEGENSPADLFYAQDPGGLGAVSNAGMLTPLPEDILNQVPPLFTAQNGDWVGISGRARVVVYNTDEIGDPAAELPDDLMGFTDPAWDGRIGWAPSNGSFQAMVTALRSVWGEEQTRTWLEGIQANNPTVYPKNTPIVEAVGNREVTVGFVNHYYLYRFLTAEGDQFPARNYFLPSGGPGSLIMVSGAGILNTAENGENAQRFVEFLLSVPGQQYFAAQTFEYPLVEGVNTVAQLPPLEELDAVAIDISLGNLADLQGTQDMLIDLGIIE
ncbi:MAG: iron ABC transporter substrate-binding protein [Ardenticatenaceae bacterium]|nr:iron ABC transporter substrate-binding protein [Ardenticatenaceae bacterium]